MYFIKQYYKGQKEKFKDMGFHLTQQQQMLLAAI